MSPSAYYAKQASQQQRVSLYIKTFISGLLWGGGKITDQQAYHKGLTSILHMEEKTNNKL